MIGIKKQEPMTAFILLRLRSAAAALTKGVADSQIHFSKTRNKTREHSSAIEAAKPHLDKPRSEKDP